MKGILLIIPLIAIFTRAQTIMVYLEISNKSDKQVKIDLSNIALFNNTDSVNLDIKTNSIHSHKVNFPQILIATGKTQNKKFDRIKFLLSKVSTYAGTAKIEPELKYSRFIFPIPSTASLQNPGVIILQWDMEKDTIKTGKYSPAFKIIEPSSAYVNAAGVFSIPNLNSVIFFDRNTNKIHRILSTGKRPTGLSYNRNQKKLYVANQGSHTISSVNFPNFDSHNELPLRFGDSPTRLAFNEITNILYVLNSESSSISIIDSYSEQEIGRIQLEFNPIDMDYSTNLSELYVAGESNFLWVYNSLNYQEITRIDVSSYIQGLEINEMDNELIVSCENSRQALFLNLNTKKILRKSSLCESSSHVIFDPLTHSSLFSIPLCDQISIFKWENQYEINNIKLSGRPGFIALSPDNQFIYAVMENKNRISIINTNNLNILTHIETGGIPEEIIFLE